MLNVASREPKRFFVIEPCNTANGVEIKLNGTKLNLDKASGAIEGLGGKVAAKSMVVILASLSGYSLSIYASGRIMVKGNKKPTNAKVEKLAEVLIAAFEKCSVFV